MHLTIFLKPLSRSFTDQRLVLCAAVGASNPSMHAVTPQKGRRLATLRNTFKGLSRSGTSKKSAVGRWGPSRRYVLAAPLRERDRRPSRPAFQEGSGARHPLQSLPAFPTCWDPMVGRRFELTFYAPSNRQNRRSRQF